MRIYIIAFDEGYCALSTPIQSLPLEGKVGPKDPDEVRNKTPYAQHSAPSAQGESFAVARVNFRKYAKIDAPLVAAAGKQSPGLFAYTPRFDSPFNTDQKKMGAQSAPIFF